MNKILSMTKDIEKSFKSQNRLTVVAVAGSLIFALVVGLYMPSPLPKSSGRRFTCWTRARAFCWPCRRTPF